MVVGSSDLVAENLEFCKSLDHGKNVLLDDCEASFRVPDNSAVQLDRLGVARGI